MHLVDWEGAMLVAALARWTAASRLDGIAQGKLVDSSDSFTFDSRQVYKPVVGLDRPVRNHSVLRNHLGPLIMLLRTERLGATAALAAPMSRRSI